jgi:hypothetical protein
VSPLASTSEGVLSEECIFTPEGYGFSAPADRILKESGRAGGFYRALGKELVIDVMEAITTGDKDVALVYNEENDLLGIFTESDYIKVRRCRRRRS